MYYEPFSVKRRLIYEKNEIKETKLYNVEMIKIATYALMIWE